MFVAANNKYIIFICSLILCLMPYQSFAAKSKVKHIARIETTPKQVKKFSAWAVYKYKLNNHLVCYALSAPISVSPSKLSKYRSYFLISRRPNLSADMANLLEPQFLSGYKLKQNSNVTLNVLSRQTKGKDFNMYVRNECAWLHSSAQEHNLITFMQKGAKLNVMAISDKNTKTNYSFSLMGLEKALREVRACR